MSLGLIFSICPFESEDVYSERSAYASLSLVDDDLSSLSVTFTSFAVSVAFKSSRPLLAITKVLVLKVISMI